MRYQFKLGKESDHMGITYVLFIIDASGSMQDFVDDTIGGYNGYLKTLEKDDDEHYKVTTILFSSHNFYKVHGKGLAPSDPALRLDGESYRAMGMTALLDAVGRTLTEVSEVQLLAEEDRALCIITTDGQENNSNVFTFPAIRALIKAYEATGIWEFLYMSNGIDGWAQASLMGMRANSYVGTQVVTGETISAGYETAGKFSSRYAGGTRGQSATNVTSEHLDKSLLQDEPGGGQ